MRHQVGVTVHGSQSLPTPPVLHPWLPLWSYIGSCCLLWGANALPGWGDCSWQSIAAHSTCSLSMFGLGAMVIAAVSCLTTTDIGLPCIVQTPEWLDGFTPLEWVNMPSLSTHPAP